MKNEENVNEIGGTEDFEFAVLSEAVNYRSAVVSEFEPFLKGRVLEVGAGIGQTTAVVAKCPRVEEVVAVEPDPRFHSRFLDGVDGVSLVKGLSSQLKDDDFDAVITVNVMEHIEDDLGEFRNQHRLLEKKGGHLCCLVPARPEIFAPLDEHFGHFRRYTKKQLTDTVEKAGFRVVKVFYFNWVGYFAWAVRFKIFRKMNFDLGQVRLFDRRIFPLSHWFEKKVMRPPIGQSLIIIAHPKTE